MQLLDLNRTREIGASSIFARIGPFNILFDAGTSPREMGFKALPDYKRLGPIAIDLVLLSHCHLDHVGSLPFIMKQHPQARVLMSQASHIVLPRILGNSITVMKLQRDEFGVKEYPLYNQGDVEDLERNILPMAFGKSRTLRKGNEDITITFYSAGHVVGASSILIEYKHQKLFYTGDVCFRNQRTLPGAKWPKGKVDVVITETTRGSTERKPGVTAESEISRLINSIGMTLANGGSVLIPSFAFGRMQEILKIINNARKEKKLPAHTPVFCSGLGYGLIDDFDLINKKISGVDFKKKNLKDLKIRILRNNDPIALRKEIKEPSLFVLSSGMLTENTSAYHVAAALAEDSKNSIYFVGFCDESTPGYALQQTSRGNMFMFSSHHLNVRVNATIDRFDLSGHANREEILKNVLNLSPRSVVLVHGEEESRNWFMDNFIESSPKTQIYDMDPCQMYTI